MIDSVTLNITTQGRTTPFSPTCTKIMDLFLEYPQVYFTPKTASLCLELPYHSIKNCMSLLSKNSYLTNYEGHAYHITKENMEFWATDFKKYVLHLQELKEGNN